MLIDWFTVAVQVVNFLVLIALLRRFLYGPVLRFIDDRQRAIDESLAVAARVEREAAAQAVALAGEREALSRGREDLMRQAARDVESWREATMARLGEEMEEKRRLWRRQVAEEQDAFFERLKVKIGVQVVRVAGKVLADLADERIEARLVEHFLAGLGNDDAVIERRASKEPGVLLVATGFALTPDERDDVRSQLITLFGAGKPIICTEDAGLGFGIRLTAGDQAWEWNLARYLEGLERDIRQALAVAQT